jgi:outer membrane immunogenic protein
MRDQLKVVWIATAALGAASSVQAADIPVKAPRPPAAVVASTWTGFYVGANGGYGLQSRNAVGFSTNDVTPVNFGDATAASRGINGHVSARGWFIGGQAGYNRQFGQRVVAGIEADIQHAEISDRQRGLFTNPNGTFPIAGNASIRLNWFGTVRGRIGVTPIDNLLLYATGGFAYGNVDYNLRAAEVGALALFRTRLSSDTRVGYAAGGGAEYRLLPNVSIKAEYQYIDLGTLRGRSPVVTLAGGVPTGEVATMRPISADFHTARVGLNYWLGSGPVP